MPVANLKSRWKNGLLVFEALVSGAKVVSPGVVYQHRARFTAAEVNTGAEILPAVPGFKYRMHDMALIAVGGSAATATSVDIKGTQSASVVKLMDARVAGLTENTLLRAGTATNGLILAAGASYLECDVNTAITIGSTTNNLATATHIDVHLTYSLVEA